MSHLIWAMYQLLYRWLVFLCKLELITTWTKNISIKFEIKNLNEINMAETYFDYIDGYLEGGYNCSRNKPLLN